MTSQGNAFDSSTNFQGDKHFPPAFLVAAAFATIGNPLIGKCVRWIETEHGATVAAHVEQKVTAIVDRKLVATRARRSTGSYNVAPFWKYPEQPIENAVRAYINRIVSGKLTDALKMFGPGSLVSFETPVSESLTLGELLVGEYGAVEGHDEHEESMDAAVETLNRLGEEVERHVCVIGDDAEKLAKKGKIHAAIGVLNSLTGFSVDGLLIKLGYEGKEKNEIRSRCSTWVTREHKKYADLSPGAVATALAEEDGPVRILNALSTAAANSGAPALAADCRRLVEALN